jgi:NADP-dependent 3-hydroxy acid dehydrogenase YdfG
LSFFKQSALQQYSVLSSFSKSISFSVITQSIMRIFVTGSTGHIGTQVVKELVSAGHQVTGLARSTESADKLKQWGAQSRLGDLTDTD